MLLVIFGAGASYDSASRPRLGDQPPPLAKDLVAERFNGIAAQYPLSRPVIDRLRSRMGADPTRSLETELADLVAQSGDRPERREQLMVFRFYLQQVVRETTTSWHDTHAGFTYYLTLLNALYDRQGEIGPIRLATFNYDMMLESALETMFRGWHFSDLDSYLSRDDFQVFKLHGSVSWSRAIFPARRGPSFQSTIDAATELAGREPGLPESELVAGEPPQSVDNQMGDVRIPALAIPLADKTEFECPETHLTKLREDIPHVKHVLIVGWRAAEPHAVELLDYVHPGFTLGIVSGNPDDLSEVISNLGALPRKASEPVLEPDGFGVFVRDLDKPFSWLFPETPAD